MAINNSLIEVYNLMDMSKILEINYHTGSNERIQLTSDFLDNFLLVSIYDGETKKARINILYRINMLFYSLPDDCYSQSK